MSKFGIVGAAALSLSLAVATPALAQHARGGGMHAAGGGVHVRGGNFGGMRASAPSVSAQANFRGANASLGAQTNVGGAAVVGRGGGHFARGGVREGFRGDRYHGWGGAGAGLAAGLAAGSALGYGVYGGYDDPYYYGDYAYDGDYYDPGDAVVVGQNATGDAYCAQRYRSYDPASGTYLGFDGLRHPCP